MSFKAPSIKQQFENRNESNKSNDDIHNPIEGERFRIEAQEFVEEVDFLLLSFELNWTSTFCLVSEISKDYTASVCLLSFK
eukprot:snap_masked-scaffold_65-processed-gene-0.26-mRNA-1 protein AED:1.00 eAED:1.00 QI:0/0/0/0/1/1/4/0/80